MKSTTDPNNVPSGYSLALSYLHLHHQPTQDLHPLLARVHVHLADSKPLKGIAWHVLHDAIHPDYLLVMTHLKRIARHQDREKETQWAERVARKIEELRESMGVVAQREKKAIVWLLVIDAGTRRWRPLDPPSYIALVARYVALVFDARTQLEELVKHSKDLYEEWCIVYDDIEADIQALKGAVDRFNEVVVGFAKLVRGNWGKEEWFGNVKREISIMEKGMEMPVD